MAGGDNLMAQKYTRKVAQDIMEWTIRLVLRDVWAKKVFSSDDSIYRNCLNLFDCFRNSDYKIALQALSVPAMVQYFKMFGEIAVKADLDSKEIIMEGEIVDTCSHEIDSALIVANYIAEEIRRNSTANIVQKIYAYN
jgi:hypothetical protein